MKPEEPRKSRRAFAGVDAGAPLWLLVPRAAGAILLSDVLILLIFWLNFGELNGFAFGFAIFLTALQILVIVGLRFADQTHLHSTKKLKNDWRDKIAAWWLIACAFGALFGWAAARLAEAYPAAEIQLLAAAALLAVALPVLTMLPMLRYLETRLAHIQVPILFFVTLLPVLAGLRPLLRLWRLFAAPD